MNGFLGVTSFGTFEKRAPGRRCFLLKESYIYSLSSPVTAFKQQVSISDVKTKCGNSVFLGLSCLNLVRNCFFSAVTKRIMVNNMWAKNEYIKYIPLTCRLSTSHFSKHSISLSDPKMVKETVWIIGFLFTQSNSLRSSICPFSLWIVNQRALVRKGKTYSQSRRITLSQFIMVSKSIK